MSGPAFEILSESEFIPTSGVRSSRSDAGTLVTVDDHQGRRVGLFKVVGIITAAEKATEESDYSTNRGATFSWTWPMTSPAETHTVFYAGKPQITPRQDATHLWDYVGFLALDVTWGPRLLESRAARNLEDGTARNLEAA